MFSSIVLRYVSTLLQFLILVLASRSLSAADYGLYIMSIGIAFSLYYLVGLGVSEIAVFSVPRFAVRSDAASISEAFGGIVTGVVITVILLLAAIFLIPVFFDITNQQTQSALFVIAFIIFGGVVFNCAQVFVSIGKSTFAAFLFYPAINFSLSFTTAPVTLLVDSLNFWQIATASSVGAAITATISIYLTFRSLEHPIVAVSMHKFAEQVRSGFGLTILRILHVSSFWMPTIITGWMLSPAQAGVMGTAGRLGIAVSAIIAATRFVIRPVISRSLELRSFTELRQTMGTIACINTALGLCALIANLLVGEFVIVAVFGKNLVGTSEILSILLLSVVAEAVFGPVDELLKAYGAQKVVGRIYGIGVAVFAASCFLVAKAGLIYIAFCQVLYVLSIFLAMNIAVWRQIGIFVLPIWPRMSVIRKLV